jgi:hypothetical protein
MFCDSKSVREYNTYFLIESACSCLFFVKSSIFLSIFLIDKSMGSLFLTAVPISLKRALIKLLTWRSISTFIEGGGDGSKPFHGEGSGLGGS